MTVSNIGTWMQDLAAGWLMTSLTESRLMVALVQTAVSLPFFLLAFPAGALADIIDRRAFLVFTNAWMLISAALLGVVTLSGAITPWTLLGLTFALGMGNAMMRPAWGASIPDFVPRSDLRGAVTLNSTSMHTSRAIGPALGGLLLAQFGPGVVFLVNALTFLALVIAVWRWRPPPGDSGGLPVERFVESMRAGLRYARHTPTLHTVLVRGFGFFVCASASWALLPVIAVDRLGGSAQTYGLLTANLGVGALIGAIVLPRLLTRWPRNSLLLGATFCFAGTLLVIAWALHTWVVAVALTIGGVAWILVFSSLVVAAQLAVPNWVRARGLSLVMLMFGGSNAFGSAIWGRLADRYDVPQALTLAACGILAGALLHRRYGIPADDAHDSTPSALIAAPSVRGSIEPDRGPVLVTVDYHVPPERLADFLALMQEVRRIRKRDGAFFWEVFSDVEDPARYLETFMSDSWLEHLRAHHRITVTDRALLDRLRDFHRDGGPRVGHFVASHARAVTLVDVE